MPKRKASKPSRSAGSFRTLISVGFGGACILARTSSGRVSAILRSVRMVLTRKTVVVRCVASSVWVEGSIEHVLEDLDAATGSFDTLLLSLGLLFILACSCNEGCAVEQS